MAAFDPRQHKKNRVWEETQADVAFGVGHSRLKGGDGLGAKADLEALVGGERAARGQRDLLGTEGVEKMGDRRGGEGTLGKRIWPRPADGAADAGTAVGPEVDGEAWNDGPSAVGQGEIGSRAQMANERRQGFEGGLCSPERRQQAMKAGEIVGQRVQAVGTEGGRGADRVQAVDGQPDAAGVGVEVQALRQGVGEDGERLGGISGTAPGRRRTRGGSRQGVYLTGVGRKARIAHDDGYGPGIEGVEERIDLKDDRHPSCGRGAWVAQDAGGAGEQG
jgi:hypothetical protein